MFLIKKKLYPKKKIRVTQEIKRKKVIKKINIKKFK